MLDAQQDVVPVSDTVAAASDAEYFGDSAVRLSAQPQHRHKRAGSGRRLPAAGLRALQRRWTQR